LCLLNSAGVAAEDGPSLKGRLFTLSGKSAANQRAGHVGVGILDLQTGTWSKLFEPRSAAARVSPDGRFVAYPEMTKPSDRDSAATFLFDVDGELEPAPVFDRPGLIVGWGGDTSALLVQTLKMGDRSVAGLESWLVTVKTKKRTRLSISEREQVLDLSPDGRRVLICKIPDRAGAGDERGTIPAVDLAALDGTARTRLIDGYTLKAENNVPGSAGWRHRFTPDGRNVVYAKIDPENGAASLWSVDLNGENRKRLVSPAERESVDTFCISPDGKHIAAVFEKKEPGQGDVPATNSWELSILDIGGAHRRAIPLPLLRFNVLDWRPAAP
jgi:Tol biopolymer transport system component